jgi:xanthine dehydrogenase YagS FAD-binding subunit
MNSFEWIDADSVEEASKLLAEGAVAKAGGIDLLDLMKEGIVRPARVVNLRTIGGLDEIRVEADGTLRLGALATLARIAADPQVRARFGALASAAVHAATPQVRNVATIGGNLLQRPRCWYLRSEHFARSEVEAAARNGENQYHAIFDTERTPLVHASTPATALLAYDATIHARSVRGERSISIREFFLAPDATRQSDVALRDDEIITHITVPATASDTVAAYRKQTERDSYDWPICDVAVVLRLQADRRVKAAAIALGWVAPVPMRAKSAESLLIDKTIDESLAREAARAVVSAARPLSRNAYKVNVLAAAIQRTIVAAVG